LLTLTLGYHYYCRERKRVYKEHADHLSVVGMLKADQISKWRRERLADAIRYAQGPALVNPVLGFLNNPNDAVSEANTRHMLVLNRKGDFYQNTILVSTNHVILLEAVDTAQPLSPASRAAIGKALASQTPALSAIFRCALNHAHIDIAAPLCAATGQPAAVFVLRTDATRSLYRLIQFWPTVSASAETLLLERDGDSLVFLNEPKHRAGSALNLRVPLANKKTAEVQTILGACGVIHAEDYRGVDVLADVRPIPDSDWFLVTKVDEREILAEARRSARMIAFSVGLILLLSAALTAVGYRRRQVLLYHDLYRMERDRRTTHERYRTILYSIGDAVIVTDDQACVRQMNHVAETLTGWQESEALGQHLDAVFRIINAKTRQPVESPVWRVLREGKIVGLANHTLLISRDGTERPIADSGAPVRDERTSLSGVVLVFRDQSVEYAAQKALAESEAQYRDLFQNMSEGFALHQIICDDKGQPADYRFLQVNPAFERLTGLKADQIVGRTLLEVLPRTEPHWISVYGAVALEGKSVRFENYSAELDRYFDVAAFRPRTGQFCAIFTDVSERRLAAQEQAKLETQLQQAQRLEAVGRLAGGVAHDFNNMLAVIVSVAELALDRPGTTPPLAEDLKDIITASHRSAKLVKQLLAFASKQPIMPRAINLNTTIATMTTMLGRLVGEDVTLSWRPTPDIWNVRMDPIQVDQLLVNLTVNARDAIAGGGHIQIETHNVAAHALSDALPSDAPDCDYVLLVVSDDGCGMSDETLAHIFEPFFTTKAQALGTGLGLSSVYGIVKQNRGFIRVVSEPGKGSRFSIFLPRDGCRHAESSDTPPARPPPHPANAESKTILLVEDEAMLLRLTAMLLRKLGYIVLSATCPAEALEVARRYAGTIHLLLTDVIMPGMSGNALCDQLVLQRPGLRCLYMSGYTADIIAHHGVIQGDNIHFLQKPFSAESLQARLNEILSKS
jgi:PAS domain S-box-containing protein